MLSFYIIILHFKTRKLKLAYYPLTKLQTTFEFCQFLHLFLFSIQRPNPDLYFAFIVIFPGFIRSVTFSQFFLVFHDLSSFELSWSSIVQNIPQMWHLIYLTIRMRLQVWERNTTEAKILLIISHQRIPDIRMSSLMILIWSQ